MTTEAHIARLRVVRKRSGPRVVIEFEQGEPLELDPELAVRHGLRTGAVLGEAAREELSREDEALRARRRLTAYLALRVKSVADARLFLERARFGPAAIAAALDDAAERGLLDDRRFAERYVRTKLKTGAVGPLRLVAELLSHGLAPALAEQAVQPQFELEWQRRAARALAAKQRRKKPSHDDESAANDLAADRVYDFLRRRGFEDDVAREVAEHLSED